MNPTPVTSPHTSFTGILNHAVNALTHPWDSDGQEITNLLNTFGHSVKQNIGRGASPARIYYRTAGEAVQYMVLKKKAILNTVFIHLQPRTHKEQAFHSPVPLIDGLPDFPSETDLRDRFGKPEFEREDSARYQFGPYYIHFTFDQTSRQTILISVMADAPG